MKTMIMILCAITMASCAVDPTETALGEQAQSLVCDPNCDPGGAQQLINDVFAYGDQYDLTLMAPVACVPFGSDGGVYCYSDGVDGFGFSVHVACGTLIGCNWFYQ